jgi:hypothetical protein
MDLGKFLRDRRGNVTQALSTVKRGVTGVTEAINPFDSESRGNNLINRTDTRYGLTPSFKSAIGDTNPYVDGNLRDAEGLQESKAAGLYFPKADYSNNNSRMWATDKNRGDAPRVMLHEGLHASFDSKDDNQRQQFLKLLQSSLPADEQVNYEDGSTGARGPRSWLAGRTEAYKSKQDLGDFLKLNPSMATEIHSYVPEYYEVTGQSMPQQLSNYYSQYYDTNRPQQSSRTFNAIEQFRRGGNNPWPEKQLLPTAMDMKKLMTRTAK